MYTAKQWIEKIACENWEGGGRWFMDNGGRLCNDPYDPATDNERTAFFEMIEKMETRLWNEFSEIEDGSADTEEGLFCLWLEKIYKERYS